MTASVSCPSFTDLRAFAAAALPGADPFGADRAVLALRPGPVEVGAIALAAGNGRVAALAGDWWLAAAEGTVTLSHGERTVVLSGDQSCVVPAGTPLTWHCAAGACLIYMRHTAAAPAGPDANGPNATGPVPIDLAAELAPSGAPLAELLLTPTPACRNHTDYRSADGLFTCGVWDSTPYHRRAMRYAHCELMLLLAGSVTFVDGEGRTATFRKGDILLIEQGADCSWDSTEDVAKVYAIYRPLS